MRSTRGPSRPAPTSPRHRPTNRGTDARWPFDPPRVTASCWARRSDFEEIAPVILRRMTNVERVRTILELADQMRVDDLIELFAEDAVMELPYAPGRMEKRYEGKDAILAFQLFARDSFSSFAMTIDAIHETG